MFTSAMVFMVILSYSLLAYCCIKLLCVFLAFMGTALLDSLAMLYQIQPNPFKLFESFLCQPRNIIYSSLSGFGIMNILYVYCYAFPVFIFFPYFVFHQLQEADCKATFFYSQVCVCAHACMCVRACAWMCVCACVCVCVCVVHYNSPFYSCHSVWHSTSSWYISTLLGTT